MSDYSIWLLEYARILEYPTSALIYGAHNAGTRVLPFTFFALQSQDHLVLVDTGYEDNEYTRAATAGWGMQDWQPPEEMLRRIGLDPGDVDTVILSHHHFDHAGNLGAFPNATFYIQHRDVDNFMVKLCAAPRNKWMASGLDPNTITALASAGVDGRVRLLEGEANILPGLDVRPAFDTHTDGSQYVIVADGDRAPWIIAGDAVLVDENLLGFDGDGTMIPIGLAQGGQERSIWVMEDMLQVAGGDTSRILPFHEVRTWDRYPSNRYDDQLHVAEIALASGATSRLSGTRPAAVEEVA
jgi:N-acyl homoserine lactone hydrolase